MLEPIQRAGRGYHLLRQRGYVVPRDVRRRSAFLCVSRAVAEASPSNRNAYLAGFEDDVKKWLFWFPELNNVAAMLWGVTTETPSTPDWGWCCWPSTEQMQAFRELRESVALLVRTAQSTFGLENQTRNHWKRGTSHGVEPGLPHAPEPDTAHETRRENEPPDPEPPPAGARENSRCHPGVLALATGIIYALVVYFIIGSSTRPAHGPVLVH